MQMYSREAIMCGYHKSTPWDVSEKKWYSKEDKEKSMMHILCILQYATYVFNQIPLVCVRCSVCMGVCMCVH